MPDINDPGVNPEENEQQQQEQAPQPQTGAFPAEPAEVVDERSFAALNRMFAEIRTETRAARQEREELRRILEQAQPRTPEPEIYDPQVRVVYDSVRRMESKMDEKLRAIEQREIERRQTEETSTRMVREYDSLMRQVQAKNLPTVDPETFFGTMEKLRLGESETGWKESCEMVYSYLMGNPFKGQQLLGNAGQVPQTQKGPRAQVVVPAGMPGNPLPPSDLGPRRENETLDDYRERLDRVRREYNINVSMLPEGVKIVSG